MKPRVYILFFVASLVAFSCKKDNYDAPNSKLSGRLVYQGVPIEVEYDRVPFELYQFGFGKVGPINGTIAPDGSYAHLLFNGEYKFVIRPGQGPFVWPETGGKADTVIINVNGNTVRDIEVTPYHMVRTPQLSATAGKIRGTFKIEKVITDARARTIERATLFINKTIFVSNDNNIAKTDIAGTAITDPNNITLEVTIPAIKPTQNYVYARIGVKTTGVEDWIFSPVQKINL